VDTGAGLDVCGKSRPHRDSIPGRSQPVGSRYTVWAILPDALTGFYSAYIGSVLPTFRDSLSVPSSRVG
jgi:hypothetical protein